jgi:hypothetical protein
MVFKTICGIKTMSSLPLSSSSRADEVGEKRQDLVEAAHELCLLDWYLGEESIQGVVKVLAVLHVGE